MYADGKGLPQDYVKAYVWLNLAAAEGVAKALELKEHLRSVMTADQVDDAQRLAAEVFSRIESLQAQESGISVQSMRR